MSSKTITMTAAAAKTGTLVGATEQKWQDLLSK